MAHEHYRTKGIVLSKSDSGEADQIFILYTQDFGKIEVVGRAIRKITSKLRVGIDIFYFTEIEFIQGKNRKTLTDAIAINKFLKIRKNSEILASISQITEAVSRLIPAEKKDEAIWNLLFETINKINDLSLKIENCKLKIILNYFLWNFFSLLGYSPELYSCPICAKKLLPETFFLSPQHGGVVCWQCCNFPAVEITVDTIKLIRFFLKEPMEKIERLNIREKDLQDLDKAFKVYYGFLVDPA